MADTDSTETIVEFQDEAQQPEDHTGEDTTAGEQAASAETADDDVVVTIGEETPPVEQVQEAPGWVRELRRKNREDQKRIRELEAKLQAQQKTEDKPVTLGAKPKLEDHDYDSDKYESALEQWYERKRHVEAEAAQRKQAEQQQQQAWQDRLDAYTKSRASLRVKGFEDAEMTVQETLDVTQQGIIVQGADNPALVVYALGSNPAKARELAAITDPVKFAFAVAKLEKELKVSNRKSAAPPPERTVQGTGRISGAVDSTLERLRAEAMKTGDMSKVMAYKRQQAKK